MMAKHIKVKEKSEMTGIIGYNTISWKITGDYKSLLEITHNLKLCMEV